MSLKGPIKEYITEGQNEIEEEKAPHLVVFEPTT